MINKHEVTYFGNQEYVDNLEKTFKIVNLKEW